MINLTKSQFRFDAQVLRKSKSPATAVVRQHSPVRLNLSDSRFVTMNAEIGLRSANREANYNGLSSPQNSESVEPFRRCALAGLILFFVVAITLLFVIWFINTFATGMPDWHFVDPKQLISGLR